MNEPQLAGFIEVTHTADWALRAWAADLPGLLAETARGMYSLMGARVQPGLRVRRKLTLQAEDNEGLLVAFLGELLYFIEEESLVFDHMALVVEDNQLQADLEGARLAQRSKEIKAVTYHNLAIKPTATGLEVTVVFDV
jgi:SHS2 domain-containing protein